MGIFLSYSRADEKAVKALAQGFEAARRPVWLDADLGGGDAWWDKILYNIRSCSVFVFALSDSSWQSKPCRAELDYANALGRPIIPVRVGEVRNLRSIPLAQLQIVNYRADDANSGFEVLSAVDVAARRAGPLPEPLPPEPPIPYAYLLALGRQIDTAELDQATQTVVVDQLRKALGEESEESVRQDILAMLRKLMGKPWTTKRTERDIKAVLIAHAPSETSTGITTPPRPVTPQPAPPAAEEPARRSAEPDGQRLFEQRMEELRQRQEADERRRAEERAREQPAASPWSGGSSGSGGAAPGTWQGVTATPRPPEAPHQPAQSAPLQYPQQQHPQQQFPQQPYPQQPPYQPPPPQYQPGPQQPHQPPHLYGAQPGGLPPSPPTYWGLAIVGFIFSFLFGGIAMYYASQVGQRYTARDYPGAVKASQNARTWAIVGIVVGALFWLIAISAQG